MGVFPGIRLSVRASGGKDGSVIETPAEIGGSPVPPPPPSRAAPPSVLACSKARHARPSGSPRRPGAQDPPRQRGIERPPIRQRAMRASDGRQWSTGLGAFGWELCPGSRDIHRVIRNTGGPGVGGTSSLGRPRLPHAERLGRGGCRRLSQSRAGRPAVGLKRLKPPATTGTRSGANRPATTPGQRPERIHPPPRARPPRFTTSPTRLGVEIHPRPRAPAPSSR